MSRLGRRLDFWILVLDARKFRWDDRATRSSFDARVLDILAVGRSVASVAHDLDVSDHQTIYNWRRQDRIDRGIEPGLTTAEKGGLAAAKKRIAELETRLAIAQRAVDLLKETSSKGGTRPLG